MANYIVTGGSRGIGAATVRKLARDGHKVCFLYKQKVERAHSLARLCVQKAVRFTASNATFVMVPAWPA